jgi:hypothetical protein
MQRDMCQVWDLVGCEASAVRRPCERGSGGLLPSCPQKSPRQSEQRGNSGHGAASRASGTQRQPAGSGTRLALVSVVGPRVQHAAPRVRRRSCGQLFARRMPWLALARVRSRPRVQLGPEVPDAGCTQSAALRWPQCGMQIRFHRQKPSLSCATVLHAECRRPRATMTMLLGSAGTAAPRASDQTCSCTPCAPHRRSYHCVHAPCAGAPTARH